LELFLYLTSVNRWWPFQTFDLHEGFNFQKLF